MRCDRIWDWLQDGKVLGVMTSGNGNGIETDMVNGKVIVGSGMHRKWWENEGVKDDILRYGKMGSWNSKI